MNLNESAISIGLHVEAIDKFGNWCEAEVIDIIENNLILKFLNRIEAYHLIIDVLTNKWHHIENPKPESFSFRTNMFEKGDLVLAKWYDDNYHLSQLVDITTKSETKEKEYHILYLFDNVHDVVSQSRLKCPHSKYNNGNDFNTQSVNNEIFNFNGHTKRAYKRRYEAFDDNVYYDKKMKNFTENCKLRRLNLSNMNSDSSECILSNNTDESLPNEMFSKDEDVQSSIAIHQIPSQFNLDSTLKNSKRLKRSSFKSSDYFYSDCIDNVIKEKTSTNDSHVSTPVPFDVSDEFSNHSPTSVSMTTLYSSYLKQKTEYFLSILNDKVNINNKTTNKSNEVETDDMKDIGLEVLTYSTTTKDQCLEQLVDMLPEIKKITDHSNLLESNGFRSCVESSTNCSKPEINLLTNHKSRIADKSKHRLSSKSSRSKCFCNLSKDIHECNRRPHCRIICCHLCNKSSSDLKMIQCNVCLCWSHSACYPTLETKDSDRFWECEGCANINKDEEASSSSTWYRDQCHFHSIAKNELPWCSINDVKTEYSCNIRRICEIQSFLSLSQRVLEAITRQMDKFIFKDNNNSSNQDDLDILKNLCAYDNINDIITPKNNNSLDIMNPISSLMSSHVPPDDSCFFNSTPIKNSADNHKVLNSSLDAIFDCEIQRLDIIPTAEFDALIQDLNFNTDIINKDRDSKSSILDLIDDQRELTSNNELNPEPFTQQSLLYPNLETDFPNDDISSLLLDKHLQKSEELYEDIDNEDNQRPQFLFSKFYSDPSAAYRYVNDTANATSFVRNLPQKFDSMYLDSRSLQEFLDWNLCDVQANHNNTTNYRVDPDINSVLIDNDRYLSAADRNCLQWLLKKYKSVEQLIECIDERVVCAEKEEGVIGNSNEEYHKMIEYLQWLLFTLEQD